MYIGQTTQGIETRFDQHIAEGQKKPNSFKSEWGNGTYKSEKIPMAKKGPLTPYEAHVWEKHWIDEARLKGEPIKNIANPIGETKYNKFMDLEFNNPC